MGHDRNLAKALLEASGGPGPLLGEERLSLAAALRKLQAERERQAERSRLAFRERIGIPEAPTLPDAFDVESPLDRARLAGQEAGGFLQFESAGPESLLDQFNEFRQLGSQVPFEEFERDPEEALISARFSAEFHASLEPQRKEQEQTEERRAEEQRKLDALTFNVGDAIKAFNLKQKIVDTKPEVLEATGFPSIATSTAIRQIESIIGRKIERQPFDRGEFAARTEEEIARTVDVRERIRPSQIGAEPLTSRIERLPGETELELQQRAAPAFGQVREAAAAEEVARQRETPAGQSQQELDETARVISRWLADAMGLRDETLLTGLVGEVVVGIPRAAPGLEQVLDPNASARFKVSGAVDVALAAMDVFALGAPSLLKTLGVKGLKALFSKPAKTAKVLEAMGVREAQAVADELMGAVGKATDDMLEEAIKEAQKALPSPATKAALPEPRTPATARTGADEVLAESRALPETRAALPATTTKALPESVKAKARTAETLRKEGVSPEGVKFVETEVPTESIKVRPGLQFKKKGITDLENAVTGKFKDVEVFDRFNTGPLTVWEARDGTLYVVNGHHRRELAIRTGEPTLTVRIMREADGVTEAKARAIGALQNIKDGQGAAIDAAAVIRELGISVEQMQQFGVSVRSALGRDAVALSTLSDEAFQMVASGRVRESVAAGVAEAGLDGDLLLKALARGEGLETRRQGESLGQIVKGMVDRGSTVGRPGGLFEDVLDVPLEEMARISDRAQRAILSDRRRFSAILKGRKAGRTVVDEAAQSEAAQLEAVAGEAMSSARVSEALEQEAKAYAQNPTAKQFEESIERVTETARQEAEARLRGDFTGAQADPQRGARSVAAGVRDRGVETAALPESLQRSSPRYGFKDKTFPLEFASDYDKAAYIVAGKGESLAHGKFVKWLSDNGLDLDDAVRRGEEIRAEAKAFAADAKSGTTIKIGEVAGQRAPTRLGEFLSRKIKDADAELALLRKEIAETDLGGVAGTLGITPGQVKHLALAVKVGKVLSRKLLLGSAKWADDVVAEFGEWIRPHLKNIVRTIRARNPDAEFERFTKEALADTGTEAPTLKSTPVSEIDEALTGGRNIDVAADRTRLSKASVDDEVRKLLDESLVKGSPKPDDELLAAAMADLPNTRRIAESVVDTPRGMSDTETLSNTMRRAQIKRDHGELSPKIARLVDEGKGFTEAVQLRRDLAEIEAEFDLLSRANKLAGTEAGRGFRARQLALNESFEIIDLKQRFKATHGRKPDISESAELEKIAKGYKEGVADLAAADAETSLEAAEAAVRLMFKPKLPKGAKIGAKPKAGLKPGAGAKADDLAARIKKVQGERARGSVTNPRADAIAEILGRNVERLLPETEGFLINRLAKELIQNHGVDSLDALKAELRTRVGNVYSTQQVLDAISGRGYRFNDPISVATDLERIRKEAKLESQVADAIDGLFDTAAKGKDFGRSQKNIDALKAKLKAQRKTTELVSGRAEAQKITNLLNLLDETQRLLDSGGFRFSKAQLESDAVKTLRLALNEHRQTLSARVRAVDAEQAARAAARGEFAPKVKKGSLPPELEGLLDHIRKSEVFTERLRVKAELEEQLGALKRGETIKPKTVKSRKVNPIVTEIQKLRQQVERMMRDPDLMEDSINTLQNLGATADNSGLGRHALNVLFYRPGIFFKRAGHSLKSLVSEDFYIDLQRQMTVAPRNAFREKFGGVKTGFADPWIPEDFRGSVREWYANRRVDPDKGIASRAFNGSAIWFRESAVGKKFLLLADKVNRAAERAFNTIVSGARNDLFDSLVAGNPGASLDEIREFGRTANVVTGRADLKDMGRVLDELDRGLDSKMLRFGMWSPRFAASKPQMYAAALGSKKHLGKASRQILISKAAATIGTMSGIAALLPDWEFNITDLADPNWLKLHNTKTGKAIDVWGGDLPLARVIAQGFILGVDEALSPLGVTEFSESAKKIRGKLHRGVAQDMWLDWLKNKAGPAIGFAGRTGFGTERFGGQIEVPESVPEPLKFGARRAKGFAGAVTPLAYRDLQKEFAKDWKGAIGSGIMEFVGVGVNVIEPKKVKATTLSGGRTGRRSR